MALRAQLSNVFGWNMHMKAWPTGLVTFALTTPRYVREEGDC